MKEFIIEGRDLITLISCKFTVLALSEEEAIKQIKKDKPNFFIKKIHEVK